MNAMRGGNVMFAQRMLRWKIALTRAERQFRMAAQSAVRYSSLPSGR